MYEIRRADPPPASFTRRGRPGGIGSIRQIQIHATRGPTTMDKQVQATENWFANQPGLDRIGRPRGWGSSADFVLGPDHRINGDIAIVQFDNWERTFGSWSAGYGSGGAATEYGAAEVGVAIEVAQPPKMVAGKYVGGDSDVPFTDETIEALVWLCKHINQRLADQEGHLWLNSRIEYWSQKRNRAIPRGYIGHEDLENGHKLGKSDPGAMFPWEEFIRAIQPQITGGVLLPLPLTRMQGTLAAWYNGTTPVGITREGKGLYTLTRKLD